ncbi:MAG: heme-binding protein [Rhodobacteraceae bacterium]|nr:heme-binding protein [Paracoccaceae bacterium]
MRKFLLSLAIAAAPGLSSAIEEPFYEVKRRIGEVEVRRYAPYVVAEVIINAPAEDAGGEAFPILAGYIFGKNKGLTKFAMTAPVTLAPEPTRLEMTSPVTQAAAPGGYRVQFVLPRDVTLALAPEPDDARVQLREVPASTVAVLRYSGFWTQANYDQHLAELETALRTAEVGWLGEPVLARYNPPFMPWFLRRNEIWLRLRQ